MNNPSQFVPPKRARTGAASVWAPESTGQEHWAFLQSPFVLSSAIGSALETCSQSLNPAEQDYSDNALGERFDSAVCKMKELKVQIRSNPELERFSLEIIENEPNEGTRSLLRKSLQLECGDGHDVINGARAEPEIADALPSPPTAANDESNQTVSILQDPTIQLLDQFYQFYRPQLQKLVDDKNSSKSQLEKALKESEDLRSEVQTITQELRAAREVIVNRDSQITQYKNELTAANDKNQTLSTANTGITNEFDKQLAENEVLARENANLKKSDAEKTKKILILEEAYKSIFGDFDKLQTSMSGIRKCWKTE